jgi:replicative DNA helicase
MNLISKIFGVCLSIPYEDSRLVYSEIKKDWLKGDFEHQVYKGLEHIYESGKDANILNLVQAIRNVGTMQKDYIVKISKLTSAVSPMELMQYRSILTALDINHREQRLIKLSGDISHLLTSGVFNVDNVKELFNEGLSYCEFDEVKQEDNVDTIFQLIDKHNEAKMGIMQGIKLPYSTFNKVVLLEDVDLMVVGARPAMGKTAFVVSTAVKMALSGKRVMIFALEMSRLQMMRRIVAHLTAIDSNIIKYGECNSYQMEMINRVQELPELENIVIIEGSQTISDIARHIQSNKPDVAFVDYLQKIKPDGNLDLYTAVTKASNGLKEISQMQHVSIIAMAQLSRPESHRAGKRPSLPDLRQSGEIEQDASIVAFIHRPEYYGDEFLEDGTLAAGMSEVIIAKNREGEVGVYPMRVNLKISKFMDCDSSPVASTKTDNPF